MAKALELNRALMAGLLWTGLLAQVSEGQSIQDNIQVIEALAAQGQSVQAAEALKAILPPENTDKNPSAQWPLDQEAFNHLLSVSRTLEKKNALAKGQRAKLLRAQSYGYLRVMLQTVDEVQRVQIYNEWSELRLKYLKEYLLGRERWKVAESFMEEGKAQGLKPYEIAREAFTYDVTRMERSQFIDSILDEENKYWLKLGLDRSQSDAERANIKQLLKGNNVAARAEAAALIKESVDKKKTVLREWRKHDEFFNEAVTALESMFLLASTPGQQSSAFQYAVELATKAERLYVWPLMPMAPQLLTALAFAARMPEGAERLKMETIHSLALARRGDWSGAARIQESIFDAVPAETATKTIEEITLLSRKRNQSAKALDILRRLEGNSAGASSPAKRIKVRLMTMWIMSWQGQHRDAVAVAKQIMAEGPPEDLHAADIWADVLCHGYLYATYYLEDPVEGSAFLAAVNTANGSGQFTSLLAKFQKTLSDLQTKHPRPESLSQTQ